MVWPLLRVSSPSGAAPDNSAQRPTNWHAQNLQQVLQDQAVEIQNGLSSSAVALRLQQHGFNRLPVVPGQPAWRRLLLQFHNPLIYVLLIAGVLTMALQAYMDAAVILLVVVINALIGFVQEGQAEKAMNAVRGMLASRAMVWRDGVRQQITAEQLVPGDLVLLESGDKVPADMRLVRCKNLRITEAALTGESVPVNKHSDAVPETAPMGDRSSMAYSGTLVAVGQGMGVVVATGARTAIGQIGTLVGGVQSLVTPLTHRLDQFATQITAFILGVGALSFAYGYAVMHMPVHDLFMAVVGLAVAAIPEGLPAMVTVVLAIGTRNMARQKAIVRRLPAVEALGSVSVICTDKTGTLTQNEMTAVHLALPQRELRIEGVGYAPVGGFWDGDQAVDPAQEPALLALARCAGLCNEARIERVAKGNADDGAAGAAGVWQMVGDPTEGALITLACKAGLTADVLGRTYQRLDVIPFESQHRFMATLVQGALPQDAGAQDQCLLLLKGAPEVVLNLCTTSGGMPLDLAHWQAAVADSAALGQRVLALAQCAVPEGTRHVSMDDITPRFELLGLVGLIDPPRPEAMDAVAQCQQAGIRVKMITGDHALTAAAIGAQLGLTADHTLTGEAIEAMDDETLKTCALQTDVFARSSPVHKLRLVHALQAQGHLVAMTGDGVNDAPALKAANLGVAMGHKGTDAAREAADMVLTDDNFATIARAVREGRVVFDNIKKTLLFTLPTNGGEAGVILLAIFAGVAMPVTAGQILWVNLITAVTLSLALAFEPGEEGVMRHGPRPPQEPLLTRPLVLRIVFVSLLMVVVTFFVFEWELARGSSLELARTGAVNMLVLSELFYLFHARHFTRSAFRLETLTGNPVAIGVGLLMVVIQLLFTYAPFMQAAFQTQSLDTTSWVLIGVLACAVFLLVELEKAVWRYLSVRRM
ncbi:HAD-IC family P-type ATPase [Limnohabitans sp. DM1]|uniref:HAD-IC family P-type ATPase n=1 Tax=Limnohabitans sp. DM1 TaxID=1597955 RepID=UPI000ABCBA61|nr:HAD-IC family P-type ATPase [Limnohabitans sp. DM1]